MNKKHSKPILFAEENDIKNLIIENITIFQKEFKGTFYNAVEQFSQMEIIGLKNSLKYIYISFLRTGVLLKTPWFRLDLFDEKSWADLVLCSTSWGIDIISEKIYKHITLETLSTYFKRPATLVELESNWMIEAEKCMTYLQKEMRTIVRDIKMKYSDVNILFGEYMSNSYVSL